MMAHAPISRKNQVLAPRRPSEAAGSGPVSALRQSIGSSPSVKNFAQLKSAVQNGAPVAQLATSISYSPQALRVPSGSAAAGDITETIGGGMHAQIDPKDPIKGATTNSREIPHAMNYFETQYPNGGGGWHRGHLLNARLGGLNIPSNLAPFTNSMNTGAHAAAENTVKRLIAIDVPCDYTVGYGVVEAADRSLATIALKVTLVPKPKNDADRQQIALREQVAPMRIDETMFSAVHGRNVADRPSSPQPTASFAAAGTAVTMGGHYSHANDARIARKGWGILQNERGNDVALTREQAASVEQALTASGGTATLDTLLGASGYQERFREDLDYRFLAEVLPILRASGAIASSRSGGGDGGGKDDYTG